MWPLAEHLKASTIAATSSNADTESWIAFCESLKTKDLETALTEVALTPPMTRHVIAATWDYLNPYDLAVFDQLVSNRRLLPLTRLFEHLFRSTRVDLQVVTPNYDRLAEYAAEAGGYTAYTGFTFAALASRSGNPAPKVTYGKSLARTVSVWKVHGSFGWFSDADGVVVALPPRQTRPAAMEPVIITPGIEKYRRTYDEPFRSTMTQADDAVRSAGAYFCAGYGFNDQHLQSLLVERCHTKGVPLVLITRTISDKAHEFFQSGKCPRFMALEQSGIATRMFCSEAPAGVEIPDSEYWQLSEFLKLIM
ncbi:SIR2 family protein [Caballeronia sp. LjRoot29]|uniref:SIR2 family protein n=1 Tax=Caballeronia sp. LjRoot29 TaxID=3342315 RepID=UPI003ECE827F